MKLADEIFRNARAHFHSVMRGRSGEAVEMWYFEDAPTGETLVTVAVPRGRSDLVEWIAEALREKANRPEDDHR